MKGKELEERVDYLLEVVGLKDAADKRAGRYSGGMKKRLDLASTLVHKPKVLFLDEPTTGLDPQSRATVWDYLEELNKKEGITIFLTTQYLEEADRLCQRLCIVDAGKIVAEGSPLGLKKEIGADAITITVAGQETMPATRAATKAAAKELLSKIPAVIKTVDTEEGLTIYVKNGGLFVARTRQGLRQDRHRARVNQHLHAQPRRRLPASTRARGSGLKSWSRKSPVEGSGAEGDRSYGPLLRHRNISSSGR